MKNDLTKLVNNDILKTVIKVFKKQEIKNFMHRNHKETVRALLFLSIVVSVLFVSTFGYAANIWEKRKKALEGVTEPQENVVNTVDEIESAGIIDPSEIFIPEQYGTVIETHKGSNNSLIVHIQSAHMNYEGQKNLAYILETLMADYDLNLVLLEGKVTDRDFTYIRAAAPLEERIEKADKLLNEGTITGVNYVNIASDYPISVQGIEDKDTYDRGTNALFEIDKFKDQAGEYVGKMIIAADTLKPYIYNEALAALDKKTKDYEKEDIDLLEYYEYLYNTAEENEIPLYTFPNFTSLIQASNLEKEIDLAAVRDGSASAEEMELYDQYIEATRNLNINELFKEEPLLKDVLEDTLAENYDQRDLIRISSALSIIKNLLRIKVVPEEYAYFRENKKDFDPVFWADFLTEKSGGLNLSLDIPENFYVIKDNLAKIEKFYDIAAEREKIFLKKSEERMRKDGVNFAAVVAGGFHTPTLMKLFEDEGYSYVVVSPKVTTETDEELYRSALKNREWAPDIK